MELPVVDDRTSRDCVEYLLREIFHESFASDNGHEASTGTAEHSRTEQMVNYRNAVDEIENARKKISDARAKHEKRLKKILEDSRAGELIRLKRRPVYDTLDSTMLEKYALLDSQDLLIERAKRDTVFSTRYGSARRKRRKESMVIRSDDSLFKIPEIPDKSSKTIEEIFHKGKKSRSERTSLLSIESAEKGEKPRRSIIKREQQKIILVARPSYVEFKNFQPRRLYKRSIAIMNVSNAVAKFQLDPRPIDSRFSIELRSRSGDRENLAPGIHLNILASFCSDDSDHYEERMVIRVQYGKDVCIFLRAYREPPILRGKNYRLISCCYDEASTNREQNDDNYELLEICGSCENSSVNSCFFGEEKSSFLSSETSESSDNNEQSLLSTAIRAPISFAQFECGQCFVGEQINIVTKLKNVGGDGKFFTMSEIDWNSMSIDDINSQNFLVLPYFAMWPVYFALRRNEEIYLLTYFFPDSRGIQVDKIYILCDNLAVHPVELIGEGVMYDPSIVNIVKSKVQSNDDWFGDRSEDGIDCRINLYFATPRDFAQDTLTLRNRIGIEIHYRWDKTPSVRCLNEEEEKAKSWADLPLDLLSVRPSSGIFDACSSITFEITVPTTFASLDSYRAVIQFVLVDIPLAAISLDHDDFTVNCTQRRRSCGTSVDVRAKAIEVRLRRIEGSGLLQSFSVSDISHENIDDDGGSSLELKSIYLPDGK